MFRSLLIPKHDVSCRAGSLPGLCYSTGISLGAVRTMIPWHGVWAGDCLSVRDCARYRNTWRFISASLETSFWSSDPDLFSLEGT